MKSKQRIEIPGWQNIKLGEICFTSSGGTPSRAQSRYYNGTIPWVKSGELNKGLILDTEEKITEEAVQHSSAKLFPKGTLLIALYGATIGKLAFLGVHAATNQAVCGIFENDKINSNYLYYFLFYKKPDLVKQSIGGAQPNISQGILKDLEIPLPRDSVQLAIVSKIEELFSDLDHGKQQLLTAQQQLRVYRQSLLKAAFEGKLTAGWREAQKLNENETLALAAEPEVKYGNSMELPEGWKLTAMNNLIEKPQYGTSKKCDYETNGVGVLRIPNISEGYIDSSDLKFAKFDDTEIETYRLKVGDILIIRSNGSVDLVGKSALINQHQEKYLFAGYLIKLRPRQKFVLPKYLLHVLSSNILRNQIEGKAKSTSGVNNINSEELKSLIIPICSLEEQQLIVDELESKLTVSDKMEETITQSLQQAETLKQSILKRAFEGRLVNHNEL